MNKTTSKILKINPKGRETVYDFTVKDTHRILANNFYTSNCNHPEIETFINIKRDLTKVTGANISVRLNDEFMHAVKNDEEFQLQWPVDSDNPEITKTVRATDIWDQIIDSAHQMAEPGIFFWDNVINNSIPDCYADLGFKTVSSNPCGEIILSPLDSCRLMVVNLAKFVQKPFTKHARFNWDKFSSTVQKSQRLMDDLIDLEIEQVDKIINKIQEDPEPENVKQIELELWQGIREQALKGRRTGLGVTAVADTLAMLGQKYGSEESVTTIEKIYRHLGVNAHISSCILAGERGTFPIFDHTREIGNKYLEKILAADNELGALYSKHGRRNIALTTTAPAGCLVAETEVKTDIGVMTLEDIFYENDIDINDLQSESRIWFEATKEINVFDVHGQAHSITRLFWNGKSEGKIIKTSAGNEINCSDEHKMLILSKCGKFGIWKRADEIIPGDKIVKVS